MKNAVATHPAAADPYEIDGDLLKMVGDPFTGNNPGAVYTFMLANT